MKKVTVAIALLTIPTLCFGRLTKSWTYQELFDQADLVAIGAPVSTQDTKEKGGLPGWETVEVVGVATEFQSSVVMKGDKALKTFVLHHYRLKDPNRIQPNAPSLVSFKLGSGPKKSSPKNHQRYILFLKKESDGRYAPVSGQIDPAVFDILKLDGIAK
jgi:hypothetical protein